VEARPGRAWPGLDEVVGEQGGLVVAAAEGAPGVERGGRDEIPGGRADTGGEQAAQGAGERPVAAEFEAGEGLREGAFVGVEGVDAVDAALSAR
jgi:hypothetical protein